MTPELIQQFAEHGIIATLLVVMLIAYKRERENSANIAKEGARALAIANERALVAERSRTEDAQKVASMLLDQQEKTSAAFSTMTTAIQGQQYAISAIEQEVRRLTR